MTCSNKNDTYLNNFTGEEIMAAYAKLVKLYEPTYSRADVKEAKTANGKN